MNAQLKVRPTLIVTVEGETQKDLFQQLASATEVFGERSCGLCDGEDLYFSWRRVTAVAAGKKKAETFEYPEMACSRCGARLSMGCSLEGGGLFPKRKLIDNPGQPDHGKPDMDAGKWGSHRGWTKYRGEKKQAVEE